ncbi:MAG: hypothetical protein K2J61_00020, partial [Clostridia bacterium]|nr:hypothetical protein [Clostridia bacterium]
QLMAQIAELNDTILREEDGGNYLYHTDEYTGEDEQQPAENAAEAPQEEKKPEATPDGYELPEFLSGEENVIEIK